MKAQWVKWKSSGGPQVLGQKKFNTEQPIDDLTKVIGVVARCEGHHDTVVMYDGTGVTWGFMQWTFTSGRLQALLEYFKHIPAYDFSKEEESKTLFDLVFCDDKGEQLFRKFGFEIRDGKFVDVFHDKYLNPELNNEKQMIVNICMGRGQNSNNPATKHAMELAELFYKMGQSEMVAIAQIQFAKREFEKSLKCFRKPLGEVKTIENLLSGTWGTPLPALFFNLWQNNPGAAYTLTLRAKGISNGSPEDFFDKAWRLVCLSKFGNWGFGKSTNKSPRAIRIKNAINEFYGVELSLYK